MIQPDRRLPAALSRAPDPAGAEDGSATSIKSKCTLRQSRPRLVEALARYDRLRSLGVGEVVLSTLPAARIRSLAQQAVVRFPATLRNWSEHHLLGTLLAFAWMYETRALDDALDLFDVMMILVFETAEEQSQEWQRKTRQELDPAALCLAVLSAILVDLKIRNVSVRKRAYEVTGRELIVQAIQTVHELTRSPEGRLEKELVECYRQIVLFLPTLLRTIDFQATKGGQGVLKSLRFVRDRLATLTKADFAEAPRDDISCGWERRIVDANWQVDSRAYIVWVASRLRDGLRRHGVYVPRSEHWGNVQLDLISPTSCRPCSRRSVGRWTCRPRARSISPGSMMSWGGSIGKSTPRLARTRWRGLKTANWWSRPSKRKRSQRI